MKNNKGNEKFTFVASDTKETKEVKKVVAKPKKIVHVEEEYDIGNSFYFGFKQRVIIILILIIIVFGLGSFLVINSYKLRKGEIVTYSEVSDSIYNVCLVENDVYIRVVFETVF